jgi:yecA family protein
MTSKARYTSRYVRVAPAELMPPNLHDMGSLPFTAHSFAELDAWLAEDGWPPEHMDAATLEGYLVALLAWPIELSAGAWLPPIWGIRGWKVAAKIATRETYDRFLLLVIGFLQDLERRLTASPPLPSFVLDHQAPIRSAHYFAGAAWATGFMIGLHENSAGLGSRSANARSAVEGIARFASLRSAKAAAMPSVAAELNAEIAKLMAERPTRLELGPLSLRLSGGARGGTPRHVPIETVNIPDAARMQELDDLGAARARGIHLKVDRRAAPQPRTADHLLPALDCLSRSSRVGLRTLQPCSPAPDAGPTILRPTHESGTPMPGPDARVAAPPQARRPAPALARPRH